MNHLWIGLYHHRHGVDPLVIRSSREPSTDDFQHAFPYIEFEFDREDEYLEVVCVEDESVVTI